MFNWTFKSSLWFAVLSAAMFASGPASAQLTSSPDSAPNASLVLASSIAAAGISSSSSISDTVAEVEVTAYTPKGATVNRSRVKTLGFDKFRVDSESGSLPTVIANGPILNVNEGSEVRVYSSRTLGPLGLSFIPWLGIAQDLSDPTSLKKYIRLESTSLGSGHRLRVTRQATGTGSSPQQYDVLVDAASSLITSVSFLREAPAGRNLTVAVEFKFSNFQRIKGVVVPTLITEYIRNQKAVEIRLLSFEVNQGVQFSDFEVKAQ